MEDAYGHRINYLRISVTDRCNERCGYCLPEEQQEWADRKELLTDEEILRTLEAALALGLRKVRVTGGEPLLRPGIVSLLGQMRALPGLEELAVSSNGTWLARPIKRGEDTTFAEGLWKAGVRSLNLSLDTLDQEAYAKTTGRDLLPAFREGLHAAKSAGFERIRLNCVLARGRNEHELWDLTEFAHEQGCLLRFIELMPVSTREVLDE
ncbi:MAG: radical SAM protein, partial [Verrucomicrobiota bacterium]